MAIALSIFGVAFAAFCVWLTVRIVNRRERWAKWTLPIVLMLAYPGSLGPWFYLMGRLGPASPVIEATEWQYRPLIAVELFLLPDCVASHYHDYHAWWHMQGIIDRFQDSVRQSPFIPSDKAASM